MHPDFTKARIKRQMTKTKETRDIISEWNRCKYLEEDCLNDFKGLLTAIEKHYM